MKLSRPPGTALQLALALQLPPQQCLVTATGDTLCLTAMQQALHVIYFIKNSCSRAGRPSFAMKTLSNLQRFVMSIMTDDVHQDMVFFSGPAWGCVGRHLPAFQCLCHLTCPIRNGNRGLLLPQSCWQMLLHSTQHPSFHWGVQMAESRQGCEGQDGVRQCIRLHSERKQIAEKHSSRQFGLNMRNGIRSVII